MSPTMCFQLVCHLVDFALQPGMSGKFIHHADCGLLLLHFMDLSPHLALLFSIFLDQFRQLEWGKKTTYQEKGIVATQLIKIIT